MKKIFLIATVVFGMVVLAVSMISAAPLTCGAAGTEGMPRCDANLKAGDKCCIPAYHKGAKTAVKLGTKTQAAMNPTTINVTNSIAEQNNTTQTADFSAPKNVSATVNRVATVGQTSAPAQAQGPAAPSVPAATGAATASAPKPTLR